MENNRAMDEPRLWSLLSWELWDFTFSLEARLGGLWDIITNPTREFMEPPTRPDRFVKIQTLSNGNPDKQKLYRDVQKIRSEHTKYITSLAYYEDQVEDHASLKAFVRRTVNTNILAACCPEEADIRDWYNNIKAHVAQWKRESGMSRLAILCPRYRCSNTSNHAEKEARDKARLKKRQRRAARERKKTPTRDDDNPRVERLLFGQPQPRQEPLERQESLGRSILDDPEAEMAEAEMDEVPAPIHRQRIIKLDPLEQCEPGPVSQAVLEAAEEIRGWLDEHADRPVNLDEDIESWNAWYGPREYRLGSR
jgi:rubrerythrin